MLDGEFAEGPAIRVGREMSSTCCIGEYHIEMLDLGGLLRKVEDHPGLFVEGCICFSYIRDVIVKFFECWVVFCSLNYLI